MKVGTKQVNQIDLDHHTEKFILVSDRDQKIRGKVGNFRYFRFNSRKTINAIRSDKAMRERNIN